MKYMLNYMAQCVESPAVFKYEEVVEAEEEDGTNSKNTKVTNYIYRSTVLLIVVNITHHIFSEHLQ